MDEIEVERRSLEYPREVDELKPKMDMH